MLYIDGLVCSVNSPFFNAVGVSCQLLGESAKVNVTLNCTSCTNSFKPHAVITDGPIIIPNLPAGTYTVDVIIVDSNYINITTTEMVMVSNNVTTNISTNEPTTEQATSTTCVGKCGFKWIYNCVCCIVIFE